MILAKASVMRNSIPLDLSSRSSTPLPCFIRSRRSTPLLTPSLVFRPSPCPRSSLSLVLRSFGFFRSPTPQTLCLLLRDHMAIVYLTVCTVSDYIRVTYTSSPSPCSRSSLTLALRSFGFFRSPTLPDLVPAFARPHGYSVFE